jgi:hypothetical protein
MRPEYDFSDKKGVRGKYYRAYRRGHTVRVRKPDGSVLEQHFSLADGAVVLEPDVRKYFSTSESVNKAVRSLISLIPDKRSPRRTASKAR